MGNGLRLKSGVVHGRTVVRLVGDRPHDQEDVYKRQILLSAAPFLA